MECLWVKTWDDIGWGGQDTKPWGREAVQVPRHGWECYAEGLTGLGVHSQRVNTKNKGYQSSGKSPCLASLWLSFLDTTAGDNKYTGDWQDKTRLLLRLGEGTLWLKCDILPTTREGGRGLRWVEM